MDTVRFREFEKYKIEGIVIRQKAKKDYVYYRNSKAEMKLHKINSCTKSFVGILIGICVDKGLLKDINIPISHFFPEYFVPEIDERKRRITIYHLLTMTDGLDWPEFGEWNYFSPMLYEKDITQFVLSRDSIHEPGTHMNYNSGASFLLGEIVAKVSGVTTVEFAKLELFKPLHIEQFDWLMRETHTLAAEGIRMKIEDMLKLGTLMLQDGKYEGKQIVSKEWIEQSMIPRFTTYEHIGSYGYHWWMTTFQISGRSLDVVFALGYRGQFIVVIKELEMVAAITSDLKDSLLPLRLLENYIRVLFPCN